MTRFLNGWMERAQNWARRSAQPAPVKTRPTLDVGAIMRAKAAEKGEVYE